MHILTLYILIFNIYTLYIESLLLLLLIVQLNITTIIGVNLPKIKKQYILRNNGGGIDCKIFISKRYPDGVTEH